MLHFFAAREIVRVIDEEIRWRKEMRKGHPSQKHLLIPLFMLIAFAAFLYFEITWK